MFAFFLLMALEKLSRVFGLGILRKSCFQVSFFFFLSFGKFSITTLDVRGIFFFSQIWGNNV